MPSESVDKILPGLKLHYMLRGHTDTITRIAWSPDGRMLASPSRDTTIRLWDIETGKMRQTLKGHTQAVCSVAWSPDGRTLASGAEDRTIQLWDAETGNLRRTLEGHTDIVYSVAWSPDGRMLASGSYDHSIRLWDVETGQVLQTLTKHSLSVRGIAWSPDGRTLASCSVDKTIRLWDAATGKLRRTLEGQTERIYCVTWSPDGKMLASGHSDKTIRLWDPQTGQQTRILEGYTESITSVSFCADGRLLASRSLDGAIWFWRCDTWEVVGTLDEQTGKGNYWAGLAFHPSARALATLGEKDTIICIWDLDYQVMLGVSPATSTVHYTNAKVILVGDRGVGKTGLGLVLAGQPYTQADSTHGRFVWTFESGQEDLGGGRKQTRTALLWDLGQPGYRLVHPLPLNQVAVALVVFDAFGETDPFAGVRTWDRALHRARRLQGESAPPMKKFLVAARADRSSIGVSHKRIDALTRELGFDGYYETSAKEGQGVGALTHAIREAINWETLPRVSSTEPFQRIKQFLVEEKQSGRLLSSEYDLYHTFLRASPESSTEEGEGNLRTQFVTCIGQVESRGLIQRLSFGHLVLLQPELLDAYGSAIVNAAKEEPNGRGRIPEEIALSGRFRIPEDERIKDKAQEKLLLIATIEDLLRHEIALREDVDLVFPSQLTRERPDLPDPAGKAVIFEFEGPLLNIYATLAVRLSHSGLFRKGELWKNAATYAAAAGEMCGVCLHEVEEGHGELILFFDPAASEETRFQFEEFIRAHLEQRALPGSIRRRRVFECEECGTPLTDLMVTRRRERGFNWIECNVCGERISLLDREARLVAAHPLLVPEMDRAADTRRELETAVSILRGKKETGDYDVFISYSHKDEEWVRNWLLPELEKRGIYAYIDFRDFKVGLSVLDNINLAIKRCDRALLVLTPNWIKSEWTHFESLLTHMDDPANLGRRLVPLMLEKCDLPRRLALFTYADFTGPAKRQEELERIIHIINDKASLLK